MRVPSNKSKGFYFQDWDEVGRSHPFLKSVFINADTLEEACRCFWELTGCLSVDIADFQHLGWVHMPNEETYDDDECSVFVSQSLIPAICKSGFSQLVLSNLTNIPDATSNKRRGNYVPFLNSTKKHILGYARPSGICFTPDFYMKPDVIHEKQRLGLQQEFYDRKGLFYSGLNEPAPPDQTS